MTTENSGKAPAKKAAPKRKLKAGMGKGKGNGFEGTVAKKLSAALPINFIRSPGSGARIGGKNFATIGAMMGEEAMKLFNADVVPVNESAVGQRFKHSIETKFYATSDSFASLVAGTANVGKWFNESVVDSLKIGRHPLLIMKWNHTPIFIASLILPDKYTRLVLSREGGDIRIGYFDEVLEDKEFWCEAIPGTQV